MKHYIITTLLLLTLSQFAIGQNTFFIGQKTYPCTEKFTLKSNKEFGGHDLDVLIAKNGESGMIVLSTELMGGGVRIKGNVLIYLEDGTVLTCIDRGKFDYVDDIATTIYYLTKDEILKMKNSNINSIRFSLKCFECSISTEEGNFSASNKETGYGYSKTEKTDVPSLITSLFDN